MARAFPFARRAQFRSALVRLRLDVAGSMVVEFAMLAPVLFTLIIAVIQISLVFLTQQGLETAAENASRLVMTGQAQNGTLTATQFKTSACQGLPTFLNCNNLMIDMTVVTSFSSATLSVPTLTYDNTGKVSNSFAYSPGSKGSIVVMRLMYLMPNLTALPGFNLSNQPGGKRLMISTTVFKNEIYS